MTYEQTLNYLYSQLPMFHRVGAAAYKGDLNNTLDICRFLHHPENKFRSVHIAGTNGKGSTSHMLAAILQTAGYKTGLYTSPHLKDFRERIRINGHMIDEEEIIAFVEKYKSDFEKIQPSFFEWTVGLAFNYFANENIDIAVIETGLGGRLDSTNVITPILSVITNIGFDHMQLLGDTLEKIADEKAGIIKPNVPVIIGERQPIIEKVFFNKAKENSSAISFADEYLSCKINLPLSPHLLSMDIYYRQNPVFEKLELDLTGNYQLKNIHTVIESVFSLRNAGFHISDEHIRSALKHVKDITGLKGRWQMLSENPLTICDVAHNPDGIRYVVEQLAQIPHEDLHFVFGVVNDKDCSAILKLLPPGASYYFCKANIPRALNADELKSLAEKFSLDGIAYTSVQEALRAAQKNANGNDLIFIGGSTFVVAEVV